MADDIDVANDLMDVEISRALSKLRESKDAMENSVKHCVECEDDLPEARRKLGFKFCVTCAEEMERKQNLYGG